MPVILDTNNNNESINPRDETRKYSNLISPPYLKGKFIRFNVYHGTYKYYGTIDSTDVIRGVLLRDANMGMLIKIYYCTEDFNVLEEYRTLQYEMDKLQEVNGAWLSMNVSPFGNKPLNNPVHFKQYELYKLLSTSPLTSLQRYEIYRTFRFPPAIPIDSLHNEPITFDEFDRYYNVLKTLFSVDKHTINKMYDEALSTYSIFTNFIPIANKIYRIFKAYVFEKRFESLIE